MTRRVGAGIAHGLCLQRAGHLGARLRGLLGRDGLPAGTGLWIKSCNAVHTVGMRFTIDIVFLDRGDRVLRIDPCVVPWRVRWCARARSVVELAAGEAARVGLAVGQSMRDAAQPTMPDVAARKKGDAVGQSMRHLPVLIVAAALALPTPDANAGAAGCPDLAAAESAYRAGQSTRAMESFRAVVASNPECHSAWLRIGNLHQQRRQFVSAEAAYRRAATRASAGDPVQAKALMNLALVKLEQARALLAQAQVTDEALRAARDDAAGQVSALLEGARPGSAIAPGQQTAAPLAQHSMQYPSQGSPQNPSRSQHQNPPQIPGWRTP